MFLHSRTLLVLLAFCLSFFLATLIGFRYASVDVPEDVIGQKPPGFQVLVISSDGSFGTFPAFSSFDEGNRKINYGSPETLYSIPVGKEEYFMQSFPKQIKEQTGGKSRGELIVKNISGERQEITVSIKGDDGFKSFSQYETDGRQIFPKLFLQHYRGYGMEIFVWSFLIALGITFLTFIGVKLHYRQKLIYYSGVR